MCVLKFSPLRVVKTVFYTKFRIGLKNEKGKRQDVSHIHLMEPSLLFNIKGFDHAAVAPSWHFDSCLHKCPWRGDYELHLAHKSELLHPCCKKTKTPSDAGAGKELVLSSPWAAVLGYNMKGMEVLFLEMLDCLLLSMNFRSCNTMLVYKKFKSPVICLPGESKHMWDVLWHLYHTTISHLSFFKDIH